MGTETTNKPRYRWGLTVVDNEVVPVLDGEVLPGFVSCDVPYNTGAPAVFTVTIDLAASMKQPEGSE